MYNEMLQETFAVLEERKLQLEQGVKKKDLKKFNLSTLCKSLVKLKEKKPFLKEVSSVILQQKILDLMKAWGNKREGRASVPKFKAKRRHKDSVRYTKTAFQIKQEKLFLAKCKEPFKVIWSRELPNDPTSCTITKDKAGRYFASFVVEVDTFQPLCPPEMKSVGIDLGLTDFAVMSNGEKVEGPKPLQKALKKLKKLQRSLSKKVKGSKNWEKARLKLAKQHARVADIRHDFLHKLSTRLVHENQGISVESLSVKEMMKNPQLARHIGDASWGTFVRMLEYKCQWYGKTLVKVDRWFPSTKMCSNCHHVVGKLALSERTWTCPKCNEHHDRDVNAAKNVHHAAGLAEWKNACGAETSVFSFSSGREDVSLCVEAGISCL